MSAALGALARYPRRVSSCRWVSIALAALGCGSAPAPTLERTSTGAGLSVGEPAREARERSTAVACVGLSAPQQAELAMRVEQAHRRMIEGQFADAGTIVELGRLQLCLDGQGADQDGQNDAARALKNAMRAVAVDDVAPRGKLLLALAYARSLEGSPALGAPGPSAVALEHVALLAGQVGPSQGAAQSVAHTLHGYVRLERGELATAGQRFEQAAAADPELSSVWVAMGDLMRAQNQFDKARAAYGHALELFPGQRDVVRAIEDSAGARPLPTTFAGAPLAFEVGAAPLASARSIELCPASGEGSVQSFCEAVAALHAARSVGAKDDAARQVLDRWSTAKPVCEAREPSCASHLLPGLLSAARGFREAGRLARAVVVNRIVLQQASQAEGADATARDAALEMADDYLRIGMFGQAAEHYERFAKLSGHHASASLRAWTLSVAVSNGPQAARQCASLHKAGLPREVLADVVVTTAELLEAGKDARGAEDLLRQHDALLAATGRTARARAIKQPRPGTSAGAGCASPLFCAVRRLAGEARWAD